LAMESDSFVRIASLMQMPAPNATPASAKIQ
jgi:hypothetical protein